MKRTLPILATALLALSLTACAGESQAMTDCKNSAGLAAEQLSGEAISMDDADLNRYCKKMNELFDGNSEEIRLAIDCSLDGAQRIQESSLFYTVGNPNGIKLLDDPITAGGCR